MSRTLVPVTRVFYFVAVLIVLGWVGVQLCLDAARGSGAFAFRFYTPQPVNRIIHSRHRPF